MQAKLIARADLVLARSKQWRGSFRMMAHKRRESSPMPSTLLPTFRRATTFVRQTSKRFHTHVVDRDLPLETS